MRIVVLSLCALSWSCDCSDDEAPTGGDVDAGADAASGDAGEPDGGEGGRDAGADGSVDAAVDAGTDAGPEVPERINWIHPNSSASDYAALFQDGAPWADALAGTHVFGFFIDWVANAPEQDLADAVAFLQGANVEVAIEGGGALEFGGCDDQNGETSAGIELTKVQRIYDLGGEVTWFGMDGPISRLVSTGREGNCGFTVEQAVEETVDAMQTWHASHPDVKIGVIPNFPNWSYRDAPSYFPGVVDYGEYASVLDALAVAVDAAGERLWFVHADNPYGYAIGRHPGAGGGAPPDADWMGRLVDLEEQAHGLGMRFGLIYNSEAETFERERDQGYSEDTLAFIDAYQGLGGSPEDRVIESWYAFPAAALPADVPYTFTWLVSEAIGQHLE
jgi:hypothetical protein